MGDRPTPTDALAAVFALAEHGRFAADQALLHGTIYQASRRCPELQGLGFSAPPHARSALLDIVLGLLKAYGTVVEDGGAIVMSDAARERTVREVLPKFSEDGIGRLKRAAAVLDAVCGMPAAEDLPKGRKE